MIVTTDFVMLNLPKTGSTFARKVIKALYLERELKSASFGKKLLIKIGKRPESFRELLLPNIKIVHGKNSKDQHGTYVQIPDKYRNLQVMSVARNPYSRFMSAYEFGSWKNKPRIPVDIILREIPTYPNLSIDDYVKFGSLQASYGRLGQSSLGASVGNQTIQFIQMFFKNPEKVLLNISDSYIDSEEIFEDMAPITFLRQEHLNTDLVYFLKRLGFSDSELEFIGSSERINVSKSTGVDRKSLMTDSARTYIETRERMIFRIYKNFGISYDNAI